MHKFGLELDVFPDVSIYRYLDDVGDGSGVKQATGDYSVTPKIFLLAPPPEDIVEVERMIIFIRAPGPIFADAYGPGIDALTNGIKVFRRSGVVDDIELTDGIPIKTNAGWRRDMYDGDPSDFGPGDDYMVSRWTFGRVGAPIILHGVRGDTLEVLLNDDFSTLVEHTFKANGILKP